MKRCICFLFWGHIQEFFIGTHKHFSKTEAVVPGFPPPPGFPHSGTNPKIGVRCIVDYYMAQNDHTFLSVGFRCIFFITMIFFSKTMCITEMPIIIYAVMILHFFDVCLLVSPLHAWKQGMRVLIGSEFESRNLCMINRWWLSDKSWSLKDLGLGLYNSCQFQCKWMKGNDWGNDSS